MCGVEVVIERRLKDRVENVCDWWVFWCGDCVGGGGGKGGRVWGEGCEGEVGVCVLVWWLLFLIVWEFDSFGDSVLSNCLCIKYKIGKFRGLGV